MFNSFDSVTKKSARVFMMLINTFRTSSFCSGYSCEQIIYNIERFFFEPGFSCDMCLRVTFASEHSSNWTSSLQHYNLAEDSRHQGFKQNDSKFKILKLEVKNVLRTALGFIHKQKIGFETGFDLLRSI